MRLKTALSGKHHNVKVSKGFVTLPIEVFQNICQDIADYQHNGAGGMLISHSHCAQIEEVIEKNK